MLEYLLYGPSKTQRFPCAAREVRVTHHIEPLQRPFSYQPLGYNLMYSVLWRLHVSGVSPDVSDSLCLIYFNI